MKNLRTISATALVVVSSLGLTIPAQAAVWALDDIAIGPDNNEWRWDDSSVLSLDGPYNDMWANDSGDDDTWDDTQIKIWGSGPDYQEDVLGCADPADLSDAADGSGDKILTCDPQVVSNSDGELTVTSEYRFYADGQTLRMRYIITNTGDAEISEQYLEQGFNAYQDDDTNVSYTDTDGVIGDFATDYSTVSDTVTDEDNYIWITDNRTASNDAPVVKYAIGREGSEVPMLVEPENGWVSGGQGDGEDMAYLPYQIPTLAVDETVEFVFMVKVFLFNDNLDNDVTLDGWQEGTKAAIDLAVEDTELESNDVVFAGIDNPSRVLNWNVDLPEESGLADTGLETMPIGSAALLALVGGAAIVARRRFVK